METLASITAALEREERLAHGHMGLSLTRAQSDAANEALMGKTAEAWRLVYPDCTMEVKPDQHLNRVSLAASIPPTVFAFPTSRLHVSSHLRNIW